MSSQADILTPTCPVCDQPCVEQFTALIEDGSPSTVTPLDWWWQCREHGRMAPAPPAVTHTGQNG